MANNTTNTSPMIKAQVYSDMILDVLSCGFLPEGLYRDVSDFGDGTQLLIPTLGEMALFDLVEEQPTPMSALSTGQIGLTINQHKGVAGYVTDMLKEDAYKAAAVESAIVPAALRSIKETFETDMLAQAVSSSNGMVTTGDPNVINGVDHRWIASGTNGTLTLEDFAYAKLALDKACVPEEGRIAIVDPIVEITLGQLNSVIGSDNPQFEGIVNTGFARGRKFVRNIFGFDVWVSNRLPRISSEAITAGSGSPGAASITDGVNNIFMSIADDQTTPIMGAIRRAPRVEGHRNVSERRDEYHVTARWGFGLQRAESLVSIISSSTAYK